jgi:hypothetical protein
VEVATLGATGAYFEAHLAWSSVAWKTPSLPKVPTARAFVADVELAALFEEREVDVGSDAMDAAGSHVASDAEVSNVSFAAHALKLADGDIVLLVVAVAGEGEVGDGGKDDDGGDDDLGRAFSGCVWHSVRLFY